MKALPLLLLLLAGEAMAQVELTARVWLNPPREPWIAPSGVLWVEEDETASIPYWACPERSAMGSFFLVRVTFDAAGNRTQATVTPAPPQRSDLLWCAGLGPMPDVQLRGDTPLPTCAPTEPCWCLEAFDEARASLPPVEPDWTPESRRKQLEDAIQALADQCATGERHWRKCPVCSPSGYRVW